MMSRATGNSQFSESEKRSAQALQATEEMQRALRSGKLVILGASSLVIPRLSLRQIIESAHADARSSTTPRGTIPVRGLDRSRRMDLSAGFSSGLFHIVRSRRSVHGQSERTIKFVREYRRLRSGYIASIMARDCQEMLNRCRSLPAHVNRLKRQSRAVEI